MNSDQISRGAEYIIQRRKTLLVEMQRRKKVGGILDKRFGESDPTMNPEEKALKRFIEEKQKGGQKRTIFDLEDPDEDGQLTHFGQSLSFDQDPPADDFQESELSRSGSEPEIDPRPAKRSRFSKDGLVSEDDVSDIEAPPDRRKTKKEVMEEVIAKSKLHKYERQQAKEDDDDLRAELDKGLPDLYAMLHGRRTEGPRRSQRDEQSDLNQTMNPDRLALLEGKDRSQADKEYDERLRQMAMDQRAKPTVPTLTEEEKLGREARKLKELEENRLRRMRGEPVDSESDSVGSDKIDEGDDDEDLGAPNGFGLGKGLLDQRRAPELDVEDEDQFLIDDDLVTSGSDQDSEEDTSERSSEDEIDGFSENEDDEFVTDLLSTADVGRNGLDPQSLKGQKDQATGNDLAFTYPCPQSHEGLLEITKPNAVENLPTIVQRIRALYHPKLGAENKVKLEAFSAVLVDHISFLADQPERPPFIVLEALIRHIHSMAKLFPEAVGRAFRSHLKRMHNNRPLLLTPGDVVILTAIGSIFPTSDHFHQVVTPAMLCMARYLSQKMPQRLSDLAKGAYVCTLCLYYQRMSKRYVPEVLNYVLNAMAALVPSKYRQLQGASPRRILPEVICLHPANSTPSVTLRPLDFWDAAIASDDDQTLKQVILGVNVSLAENMAVLWASKSAACEILDPLYKALRLISSKTLTNIIHQDTQKQAQLASRRIHILLQNSMQSRTPLALHHHRPLPIKSSIPKFEESYDPSKHYDPDQGRTELSKLKAEHKKERKGALRELRKDASFMAREGLREKKERDRAYETKFKRLVAEIQGEEGKEANDYEREKRMRKGKKR